jgi:magnesium transporter
MSKRTRRPPLPSRLRGPGPLAPPQGAHASELRLTLYDADTVQVRERSTIAELASLLAAGKGDKNVWLELAGYADPSLFQALERELHVPFLALEDVLSCALRPKCEVYEQGLLMVVPLPDPSGKLEFEPLGLFARGKLLITFQQRPSPCFEPLRARLSDPKSRVRSSSIDYLTYRVLDLVVDRLFPVVDPLAERLDAIELSAMNKASAHSLRELYALVRDVRALERLLLPLRESIASARHGGKPTIGHAVEPFFRDLQDHVSILVELCSHYGTVGREIRELIHDSLNLRLNAVMRMLTALTSIFIPLSFVTGLYGMNFAHMPELRWRYGYFLVLGVLATCAIGLWTFFRRHGWLRMDEEQHGPP